MKLIRTLALSGAMLALIATGAAAQQAAPQAQQPAPTINAPLPATQALFDGYVKADKMPGITGAFGVGDLPTVFVSAGKIADEAGASATGPDSLWRVYSMTKPLTAMAAMMLIEDGKMTLDEPLSDIFPAYKNMKVQLNPDTLESRPAKSPITIRNLLTHTAGLGYSIITKGPLLKEYERLGILPAAVNAEVEVKMAAVRPKSLQEFANRTATLPLIADPGTKWSYSIGLDVMGAVIEKVSGMPFDAFVQQRILIPLKMNSSYWTVPASETKRLATNYLFVGDTRTPLDPGASSVFSQPPSFPYGGAGLVMSARDYDRFLHMLQDGGTLGGVRVMKPGTVALALSNLLPKGVYFTGFDTAKPVMGGFGAGGSVAIIDTPEGPPKGTYGWGGAAGTIAWVDPVNHARGVVMVNYFPNDKWPLRQEIPAALLKDFARWKK